MGRALVSSMHWVLLGVVLSLTVACGTQSDRASAIGGAAGASGNVGSSGNGANGGRTGQSGGGGNSSGSGGHLLVGGGGSATAGATGSGGKSGAAGGGATGAGGSPMLGCPATAPSRGAACTPPRGACFYEDCAGVGRTAASCNNGAWAIQTAACGVVQCDGASMTCSSGQMCAISQGGALLTTCTEPTCGAGPVTCACAGAVCTNCLIGGSVEQGVTVTCNTCPQGGCP